jgi:predicted O-methyltransferase YrrM
MPLAAILDFAENFSGLSEPEILARQLADELSAPVVSSGVSATLTLLARLLDVHAAVEVGTGSGVAAMALLRGMSPDGVLTSIDPDNGLQLRVRGLLTAQKIPARRTRLIAGQPLDVLPKLTDHAYDLVFIDGDPLEYVEYVAQALRLLRPGGVFILNNVFWQGKVVDEYNDEDEPLIIREALAAASTVEDTVTAVLPLGDGLLVATVP